jgi:hypothetical protein
MTGILEMFEEVVESPAATLEPELPSDPRERFAELLRRREKIEGPSSLQAQEGLEADLLEMYREHFPKRRMPKLPVLEGGVRHPKQWEKIQKLCESFATERDEVIARHLARHQGLVATAREQRAALDEQLFELAPKVKVLPSTTWTEVASVSQHTYGTQTQPCWYAHGAAELRALAYHQGGFEVEVREVTTRWDRLEGPPRRWRTYEVWAMIDELGAKVLEYRGGDHLEGREWLQACHDRILNPRVYNPFLDWGEEDRLGVRQGGCVSLGEIIPLRKQAKEEEVG